jgi:hypothetical protein
MIKTGDILKRKDNRITVKVLGVCDEVYFLSQWNDHDIAEGFYTLSELKERFEIPTEKWVPEIGFKYFVSRTDDSDYYSFGFWEDCSLDNYRLERNLIFKTKEEAIARAKQLLNISE